MIFSKEKLTRERSQNKQMAINMATIIVSFVLSTCISFFLTPFIVGKLGTTAYGFIGLSGTIIGYTSLLTVALNSMACRYVSINYYQTNFDAANRYVAATFFGNAGFAGAIIVTLGVLTVFLDTVINIPEELIVDVKLLFTLLFVNSSISLVCGVYGYATFIKNRIDLTNMRNMGATVIRAALTFLAYAFLPARLWYVGAVGIVCTIYPILMNYWYFRILTPELTVKKSLFSIVKVKEIMKSGLWNVLNSLSSILNQGLDLLLANLFISAYFMGILSITKSIPLLILGLFMSLGCSFHPEYMRLFAEKNMMQLKASILKSIRIMGLITCIPCAIMFAYGDMFFASWLPTENSMLLYGLSCVTMFGILFTLPTQSIWYVFTITDTVKHSSINLIKYGVVNVVLILLATNILESDLAKIYAVVSIQAFLYLIRFTTFLPFYSAKVLGFPRYAILKPLIRIVISTGILTVISFGIKYLFISDYNWWTLIFASLTTASIGIVFSYWLNLNHSDREYFRTRILHLSK